MVTPGPCRAAAAGVLRERQRGVERAPAELAELKFTIKYMKNRLANRDRTPTERGLWFRTILEKFKLYNLGNRMETYRTDNGEYYTWEKSKKGEIIRSDPDQTISNNRNIQLQITDEYNDGMSDHNLLIAKSKAKVTMKKTVSKNKPKINFKKIKKTETAQKVWNEMVKAGFKHKFSAAMTKSRATQDPTEAASLLLTQIQESCKLTCGMTNGAPPSKENLLARDKTYKKLRLDRTRARKKLNTTKKHLKSERRAIWKMIRDANTKCNRRLTWLKQRIKERLIKLEKTFSSSNPRAIKF